MCGSGPSKGKGREGIREHAAQHEPQLSDTSKEISVEDGQTKLETNTRWSSAKKAGQKRSNVALETIEGCDSDPEEEEIEERGEDGDKDCRARPEGTEVAVEGYPRRKVDKDGQPRKNEGRMREVTFGKAVGTGYVRKLHIMFQYVVSLDTGNEASAMVANGRELSGIGQRNDPHQEQRLANTKLRKLRVGAELGEEFPPPPLLSHNLRDRQNKGGEPKCSIIGNKSQRLNEHVDVLPDVGMATEGRSYMGRDPTHPITQGHTDVIRET